MDILSLIHQSEERGKFVRNGNPMTRDEIYASLSRPKEESEACLNELLASGLMLTDENGVVYNPRMVRDTAMSFVKSKSGSKGGNPRLVKQTDKQLVKQELNHALVSGISSDVVLSLGGVQGGASDCKFGGIDRIYAAYPRQVGKEAARRAIARAVVIVRERGELEPHAWLYERVKKFSESRAGRAGKFCPHPATWFNAGRYDDDPAEWDRTDGKGPAKFEESITVKEFTL